MSTHVIKLPDIGEGVAEAEFVELHIKEGDEVIEDQNLADVMTDKATVEIPSPVSGKIVWIGPAVGETVAVGSEIIKVEISGAHDGAVPVADNDDDEDVDFGDSDMDVAMRAMAATKAPIGGEAPAPSSKQSSKILAAPAVRAAAKKRQLRLDDIRGTGADGRVTMEDLLDQAVGRGEIAPAVAFSTEPNMSTEEIKVIGLRRRIAEKMQDAKRRIPHFSYVEETDVTALEDLRQHLNGQYAASRGKLTVLPFIMRALVMAIRDFPQINARFNDDDGIVVRHGAAHIGIATQTGNGLMVPVVRHAETMDLWQTGAEVRRIAEAARDGSAKSKELSGSTITITSLGPIGGIVTTPVINHPEVGILGINKIMTRPVYNKDGIIVPRKIMNLSSSFDHRVVDGHDAAEFIQKIKTYLENPATLFM